MRAMVLPHFNEPLQLRTMPTPEIGRDDALVRVIACGLCATDLKIAAGKLQGAQPPLIMGHEPGGVVEAVGNEVRNVKVGDHVAVALYITCGACDFCRTNQENLCAAAERLGWERQGGFAEFVKVPARNVFPVSPSIPLEHLGLFADCLPTAWHAVHRRAAVQPGQTVVVIGAGGIGVHAIQMIRLCGARAIALDVVPEKLELARKWGAAAAIDGRDGTALEQVLSITDGNGADAVIDYAGHPGTTETALKFLRRGGVLVLVGYAPGKPFGFDSMAAVLSETRVVGSRASTKQDLVDVIRLVERGHVVPVITDRFELEEVNDALANLRDGKIMGRAIVVL